jgi:universal stress protein E
MEKLTSILVVANRTTADRALLEKAVALARSVGAQIYLFSCDAELARRLRHAYPIEAAEKAWNTCLAEHITYLRRLQAAVCAPDVQISVDVACHSPLYEGIVAKIREIRADLVMKSPSGVHPLRRLAFDSNDWKLTKACPTTLMLVRPNPWQTVPKFAALVDVSEESTTQFAQMIVHTSEYFALGCHGELDVVYSEKSADGRERGERLDSLERLAREYHVEASHVHVLSGNPDDALPDFAARQNYDAIVLGALTHRKGIAGVRGMLTSRIVDAVDCDLILVERVDHDLSVASDAGADLEQHAAGEASEDSTSMQQRSASGSSVLWQSMFGD